MRESAQAPIKVHTESPNPDRRGGSSDTGGDMQTKLCVHSVIISFRFCLYSEKMEYLVFSYSESLRAFLEATRCYLKS